MTLQRRVADAFQNRYGRSATLLARAPGRVNLIGEHTDYNDGFVLPMAIDRAVYVAAAPREDRRVVLHSLDFDETIDFSLDVLAPSKGWGAYARGVAWALQDIGARLVGLEGVMAGDVPIGAGLSSSAATELALARAMAAAAGHPWSPPAMARLMQRVENEWIGVASGIMDQMISAAGEAGHALLIDCRSLVTQAAPLPPETAVVILDTATRRGLVDSAYNERRAQCEAAARFFGVAALRDVTTGQFMAKADALEPLIRRRARHVVGENERTVRAFAALQAGDAAEVGRLMNASHASLRDDFEVTNAALDTMAAIAQVHPAAFGARMTGAGFGGCAVALVGATEATIFAGEVSAAYHAATGHAARLYICHASDGVALIDVPA